MKDHIIMLTLPIITSLLHYSSKLMTWITWFLMQASFNIFKEKTFGQENIKIINAHTEDEDVTNKLKTFLNIYWDDNVVDGEGFNVYNFLKMIDKSILFISWVSENNSNIIDKIKTIMVDYNESKIFTDSNLDNYKPIIGDNVQF